MDHRQVIVRLSIGAKSDLFLSALHKAHVKVTKLKMTEKELSFTILKKDLRTLKKVRRATKVKLKLRYAKPQLVMQPMWRTFLGLACCLVVPVIASQFIWQLDVGGAEPEIVRDVTRYVKQEMDIQVPISQDGFPQEMAIRQELMAKFPVLAWVHFRKQASHIEMNLQMAPPVESQENSRKSHLVAKTAGVITHHFLTSGEMVVGANETVAAGDLLATGVIEGLSTTVVTGASGEVFADYWLETSFSMPRQIKYYTSGAWKWEVVQDDKPALEEWKLPGWLAPYVRIVKRQPYQQHERTLTEEEVETLILPLLQHKLLASLPMKTTIKSEKLLHVTIDNDKVKGRVLYLVNENIAQPIPIESGEEKDVRKNDRTFSR